MKRGFTRITLSIDRVLHEWGVTASPERDTCISLKEHLARWMPDAVFIKAEYYDENGEFVFEYGDEPKEL